MNKALLFDFTVDKENKTIHVKREFAAALPLVWQAWTDAGILDQWWAPEPWRAETKSMDFRQGGRWLYAMVGPEGERHWSLAEYISITPQKSFTGKDSFCDEAGNVNKEMPQSTWTCAFSATDDNTLVEITIGHEKPEDMEATLDMGFKEGFSMGLSNLDKLLPSLSNK